MIPPIIHQIWLGDRIETFDTLMQSVKDHSDMEVVVWEYDALKQEGLITPEIDELIVKKIPYAYITNIIRFNLLSKFGGLYLDADYLCKKSLMPLYNEYKDSVLVVAERPESELNMWKSQGHDVPRYHNGIFGCVVGYDFDRLIEGYKATHLMGKRYTDFIETQDKFSLKNLINSEYLTHVYQFSHNRVDLRLTP